MRSRIKKYKLTVLVAICAYIIIAGQNIVVNATSHTHSDGCYGLDGYHKHISSCYKEGNTIKCFAVPAGGYTILTNFWRQESYQCKAAVVTKSIRIDTDINYSPFTLGVSVWSPTIDEYSDGVVPIECRAFVNGEEKTSDLLIDFSIYSYDSKCKYSVHGLGKDGSLKKGDIITFIVILPEIPSGPSERYISLDMNCSTYNNNPSGVYVNFTVMEQTCTKEINPYYQHIHTGKATYYGGCYSGGYIGDRVCGNKQFTYRVTSGVCYDTGYCGTVGQYIQTCTYCGNTLVQKDCGCGQKHVTVCANKINDYRLSCSKTEHDYYNNSGNAATLLCVKKVNYITPKNAVQTIYK